MLMRLPVICSLGKDAGQPAGYLEQAKVAPRQQIQNMLDKKGAAQC